MTNSKFLSCLLSVVLIFTANYGTPAVAQSLPDIETARAAIARKDWPVAETQLQQMTNLFPNNPFVFYELGRVYEGTGRIDQARNLYQQLANIPVEGQNRFVMVVQDSDKRYMSTVSQQAQIRLTELNAKAPVAQTQPVAAPAPVAVVAAPPALSKPDTSTVRQNAIAQISEALDKWRAAWQGKNVNAYLASYATDFKGSFATNKDWITDRKTKIGDKKAIQLELSDVQIKVQDERARATFIQSYTSHAFTDKVNKTLDFTLLGSQWLITSESVATVAKEAKK